MIKRTVFLLIFLCLPGISSNMLLHAQAMRDTATLRLIYRGVDYIYDMQFARAREVLVEIEKDYPEHPMNYVLKGLMTYWENYPLTATSVARESYEEELKHAIELCEKKSHPDDEAEYLMCNIGARGLLLLFYADNDLSMDVIPMASSTYSYLKQTFDFTGVYSDFYFFTGLYNYYREAYPEAHPVYKPAAIIFPKGDKARGLRELMKASKSAIILKAEAYSFLTGIYINFENDFQKARFFSKSLHELYPNNPEYLSEYIRNLLLLKEYDEAERLISAGRLKASTDYFKAQLLIFDGILFEKKYHDLKKAQAFYSKGIRDLASFGDFSNDYAAYGYFGLSRISDKDSDKHYKRYYRKQAMALSSFKKVNFDD